jgi:hypothetical protein
LAARRTVCGKRRKPGAGAFFVNLERELPCQTTDCVSGQQVAEIIIFVYLRALT